MDGQKLFDLGERKVHARAEQPYLRVRAEVAADVLPNGLGLFGRQPHGPLLAFRRIYLP